MKIILVHTYRNANHSISVRGQFANHAFRLNIPYIHKAVFTAASDTSARWAKY